MKKIIRYAASDGTEHATEHDCRQHEAALTGRMHECPSCNGGGTQNGGEIMGMVRNPDYGAFGGGYGDEEYRKGVVGHEQVPCDVCEGFGWTLRQKQPITESTVIGWKDTD